MNVHAAADRLEASGRAIVALLDGVDDPLAHARPEGGTKWSVVEIVGHLVDEESLDFRARFEGALLRPDEPWDPIDPEGWVLEHDHQARDLAERVAAFRAARGESLAWLRSLDADVDLDSTHTHPRLGSLRAGDLLASWVAHDLLHLRQLARTLHATLDGEYSPAYAGPLA